MRIENYEPVRSWCVPGYCFTEGDPMETFYADSQNLLIDRFGDSESNTDEKWWIIGLYKPKGLHITEENEKEVKPLLKWLVSESYHKDTDFEFYEWDFKEHKIKI